MVKTTTLKREEPKEAGRPLTAAEPIRKKSTRPEKTSTKPSKTSTLASKQLSTSSKPGPRPRPSTALHASPASPKAGGGAKSSATTTVQSPCREAASSSSKRPGSEKVESAPPQETSTRSPASTIQNVAHGGAGGGRCLPLNPSPRRSSHKTRGLAGDPEGAGSQTRGLAGDPEGAGPQTTPPPPPAEAGAPEPGSREKSDSPKSSAPLNEAPPPGDPGPPDPMDTPCSIETPPEDSWAAGIHLQVTPESETGSNSTSSDDIKPRSEDYDAGGSQDDDCSHERGGGGGGAGGGASKCGTMRCSDFLGRSSSDTSTPEELKVYDAGTGLRVEVRLRGRDATETTSEEEGGRRRPRSWLHRDELLARDEEGVGPSAPQASHPPPSSDEEEDEETEEEEDERSEVEVIPGGTPLTAPSDTSPHFQGIVNLAFDDDVGEQESQQPPPTSSSSSGFRRSVLLSVDEWEELGSEDPPDTSCSAPPPPQENGSDAAATDVFEGDFPSPHPPTQNPPPPEIHQNQAEEEQEEEEEEEDAPPQERPCHLDLRPSGGRGYTNGPHDAKRSALRLDLSDAAPAGQNSAGQDPESPAGKV